MLALIALIACNAPAPTSPQPQPKPPEPLELELDAEVEGLKMRLSEVTPPAPTDGAAPAPSSAEDPLQRLFVDEVAALLEPLPAMPRPEVSSFAKREDSAPPPRAGAVEQLDWPPAPIEAAPPGAEPEPPIAIRYAPVGEVPMAPRVSVTFDQPMVAVTSQDDAAQTVPVALNPQPEGTWRWLGTKTLIFDPDPRLPMATEYTVEIPAGVTSASGQALAEPVRWTFATPPPSVESVYPWDGPTDLEPVIFIRFDQAVGDDVLDFVRLRHGGTSVPLAPATAEQIAADETVSAWMEQAPEGRALALVPSQPLARATSYRLEVLAGAPSAEGPRTTASTWAERFYTYHPLRIEQYDCWGAYSGCEPGGAMDIEVNNPLDAEALDPSNWTVEPPLERLQITASGHWIQIAGDTQARTTYTVTVPESLQDTFGQALGRDRKLTFRYGDAPKSLQGPGQDFVVLDPTAPPALSVYSTNHEDLKVRVFAADPSDFAALSEWMRSAQYDGAVQKEPPLERLARRVVPVDGFARDELVETALDLSPWLDDAGHGHLFVWVEPTTQSRSWWDRVDVFAWVQATDIGLTALVDDDEILAWATDLSDGAPLEGVELSLLGVDTSAINTDDGGLAALGKYPDSDGPHALVARRGDDVAMLPQQTYWWNQHGGWTEIERSDELAWFVFDDRGMYRPGETARVKGWVRKRSGQAMGDLGALPPTAGGPSALSWTLADSRGVKIGEGTARLSDLGGFDLSIALPATPNLGRAALTLTATDPGALGGVAARHSLQIQEFRRPEFEVEVSAAPRPYVLGESARVTVDARYYSGGPLPRAPVSWSVAPTPTVYAPPGWDEWRFGEGYTGWDRGWGVSGGWSEWGGWYGQATASAQQPETFEGETRADGRHTLKIDFLAMDPPQPMQITASATALDVNRQRWTDSHALTLHPSALYAGLKADARFYEEGEPVEIEAVAVGIDGEPALDVPVTLTFARLDWQLVDGRWQEVEVEATECALVTAAEPPACTFTPTAGGSHRVTATLVDGEGRPNATRITVPVAGGEQPPNRDVAMERAELIPNRDHYAPGDVARILVQSPFEDAQGLLTIQRDGLSERRRFAITGATTTLEIPITEAMVPNLYVEVDLVGGAERTDDEGEPLPDKAPRPAFARGTTSLSVPPAARTLSVQVTPKDPASTPGAETALDVVVTDAAGEPVDAEVTLVVADESVLALSGYALPDPLAVLYASRASGVWSHHLRDQIVLSDPLAVQEATEMNNQGGQGRGYGVGGGGAAQGLGGLGTTGMAGETTVSGYGYRWGEDKEEDGDGWGDVQDQLNALGYMADPNEPVANTTAEQTRTRASAAAGPRLFSRAPAAQTVTTRSDFGPLALFAPAGRTGDDGALTVPLTLPDSLTRYRVMAVAADGDRSFGAGEAAITASKPLQIRPSPPRFLNFGDRMELPIVVQNQTDEPMELELAVRVANAKILPSLDGDLGRARGATGYRLTVAARDRRELRVPVATMHSGEASFQVVAVQSDAGWRKTPATDAAEFSFPVWTPATSEAFATYGEIDSAAGGSDAAIVQPVAAPDDVWTQFGGLEVTTSATALSALTDALLYLTQYPYECNEQLSSRVLAIAALRDVLAAFEAEQLPDADELEASVAADLARLGRRQVYNGGFGFWGGDDDEPYVTVHVTHALVRAQLEGYPVDDRVLQPALRYLRSIESHIPWWYGERAKATIVAYSVYVRGLLDERDPDRARGLMRRHGTDRLSLEAQGWILPTLHAAGDAAMVEKIMRRLDNAAVETAGAAHWSEHYTDESDYVLLHASRRADGVLLDALLEVDPDHDLIPKVVRGLLGHRSQGRWSTTQENSFVLLAMNRYFRVAEAETPDFVARVWLGDAFAGEHAFGGRTTERARIDVPMSALTDPGGTQDLTVARSGPGRLYYRIGLRYAPTDLTLEPADHGFAVERTYEAADDPDDVQRQPDGSWQIRAGARVRVRVSMVAPGRRTHVALVDPLPGGFEAMNSELAVVGAVPKDPQAAERSPWWWWSRPWYEHQNLRDERVEAFTSLLWSGVHEYSYVATATTPGRFIVPPPKAEEMYHPETFGRGATDIVHIR